MDAQEHNSCLTNLPELVLEKILSNIHNPSNVARTCKYLYEIVCDMEKRRRVLYICAVDTKSPLNIDDDAAFDSIMNSHRTIKEIQLRVLRFGDSSYELNERQLERLTAIMKQFGANVTSLNLQRFALPINFMLQLLQQAPKLESLSFISEKEIGSVTENATLSLQLPSLKTFKVQQFPGLLDFVKLIPDGTLNSISYTSQSNESLKVLTTILTKQPNIKCLSLEFRWLGDPIALCIDHLQLDSFTYEALGLENKTQIMELLKCQTNLKELKIINYNNLSGSSFQWICNNLKNLEVFEVRWVESSIERNGFEMLGELKQLRHFLTSDGDFLFVNGFQSFHFKINSIQKFQCRYRPEFSCGELLTNVLNSMAHNLPNLTHLHMNVEDFSALCAVLRHCTQIIYLSSLVRNPLPDQLTDQRFPNIQHLQLYNYNKYENISDEMMSQSMTSIVRAMPNLKNMSLSTDRMKFDVNMMVEFIKESKSLEYLFVDCFEMHPELSADDIVETIQCLVDPLKGYHFRFRPSTLPEDLHWHKIKDILSNSFYVPNDYSNRPTFYLYKSGKNKPSYV